MSEQQSWNSKVLIFVPIAIGLAIIGFLVAVRPPPAQNPPLERATSVRVLELRAIDLVPKVVGYGVVKPARTWAGIAQVAGRVVHVHPDFKRGAFVNAGTEIVRIAPDDFEIAIQQAEANLRSGQAKLAELDVQERNSSASLDIERQALEIKTRELERKKALVSRGTVSQATVDLEARNLLTQRARVQDLENTQRLVPVQRAAQKEQIAVYDSQRKTAELNLKRTSIKMPFDARIAEANVEVTQYVGVGTQLGSADDVGVSEVEAQVPHARFRELIASLVASPLKLGRITPESFQKFVEMMGLHALVRTSVGDRELPWSARVVRISDTIDPKTRTVGVIVSVNEPYEKAILGKRAPLVKGFYAEVVLKGKMLSQQLVIPRSAVNAGTVALLNADKRLELRKIETGLSQGNYVVVKSGLKAGDRVVVSDLSPAIPDMLLDATDDDALRQRITLDVGDEGVAK